MTDLTANVQLSLVERERLGAIADCLISGGDGLPSAVEADVHSIWIDRVLDARPDLIAALRKVTASGGAAQDILAELGEPDLERVRYAVAGAYLINPRVRSLLGYPSTAPAKQPAYSDEADSYLDDGVLDAVIARGPIYRPAPSNPTKESM